MDEQYERWFQNKRQERQNEIINTNRIGESSVSARRNLLDDEFTRIRHERSNGARIRNTITNQPNLNRETEQGDEVTLSEIDIELNNLIQNQTVSNILNNLQFRTTLEQRLENSLSSLGNVRNTRPTSNQQAAEQRSRVNIEDVLDPDHDPELSALLNYQVVSNMLQSVFRTHLENTLWTRYVMRNQTNNSSVQERSGTFAAAERRRGVVTTENIHQNHILHSMRNEITEMRSMMRIMLQSQIETQRYIRQDLNNILSSILNGTGQQNATTLDIPNACVICLNAQADTIMYQCGHLCLCYPCSIQYQVSVNQRLMSCPVCRSDVTEILRVYTSHQS